MNNKQNTFELVFPGLIAFFLIAMVTPGNAQPCTFSDPQKQLEYEAMVELYDANVQNILFQSNAGPLWEQLGDGTLCDICTLPYILCNDNGYVEGIFAIEDPQIGVFPDNIDNLVYLETIQLLDNFPSLFIPESFGNLPNLKSLELGGPNLQALPESFGNLTKLEILRISNGSMTELPESFGNLTNVREVSIRDNELTYLPENFGNLTSLEYLFLRRSKESTF